MIEELVATEKSYVENISLVTEKIIPYLQNLQVVIANWFTYLSKDLSFCFLNIYINKKFKNANVLICSCNCNFSKSLEQIYLNLLFRRNIRVILAKSNKGLKSMFSNFLPVNCFYERSISWRFQLHSSLLSYFMAVLKFCRLPENFQFANFCDFQGLLHSDSVWC